MAMTKCRECGAEISTKAEACPKCGARRKGQVGAGSILGVLFLIVVVLALVGQCSVGTLPQTPEAQTYASKKSQVASPVAAHTTPRAPAAPPLKPKTGSQWHYKQNKDPMGMGNTYFASVLSTNTVNFGFPYSGAQHGTLTLRTHPRYGKDVILSIERGQFLCPSYEGCTVLVRFDDGTAYRYSAAAAADNSTETVFIRAYTRFVGHMLKSKRVRISANVYQEGAPVFEYNVAGFDVHKYKPAAK